MDISAPAKIILFGEHAVVHGQPAMAVPVSSLRATATIAPAPIGSGLRIHAIDINKVLPITIDADLVDNALALTAQRLLQMLHATPPDITITVKSTIPMAGGLGSGAAVSTAIARAVLAALNTTLPQDDLNALIYEVEKIYHGTPSGIDNTVIVYEKPVYFVRGKPIETLPIASPFTIIIADTGHAALTRIAVGDVGKLVQAEPERMHPILQNVGQIVRQARDAIVSGKIEALGPLMTQNHAFLQQMTVSSDMLDQLVDAAMGAGALGAKLSGGGRGGNMIALVTATTQEKVRQALVGAGAVRTFVSTVR